MKNTVINIVAGLGLISFITMFCDFIMLNYVSERKIVGLHLFEFESLEIFFSCIQIKQKKFEVLDRRMMFSGLMALVSVTSGMNGRQEGRSNAQVRPPLQSDWVVFQLK